MTLNKNNLKFDIVIIGAGPVGIAFACGFANTKIKVAIVDKLPNAAISNPKIDGREIALTHQSIEILKKIGVWQHFPKKLISVIKEARILDGNSRYFLNFNHQEIQKENLGYLIPNYLIKKKIYKRLKKLSNVTLIDKTECVSINTDEKNSLIALSDGTKIKTNLVVAADSRFSKYDLKWVSLRLFVILIKI